MDAKDQTFAVCVRWMVEAIVEVKAPDEDSAISKVQDSGLPWGQATEADDGEHTSWECVDLERLWEATDGR